MIDVLETTKFVVDNSKLVTISKSAIEQLVRTIRSGDLQINEAEWTHYKWSQTELIKILFVFDAVNYCFWAKKDEQKWQINIDEEQIDGSIALLRCIEEEVKKNPHFVEPRYLAKLTEFDWERITKGYVKIPLFLERLSCLKELGAVESFASLVQQANNNATTLLEIIIANFPSFNDVAIFDGRKVEFYKRAQLLVKGISDAILLDNKESFFEIEKLTAFADYKIPQVLRKIGIIEYVPELANKIDSYKLIDSGSREELEIRANTIWAVENIRGALSDRYEKVTAAQVDTMLWKKSQEKTKDEKPYHRTLTIAY